MALVSKNLADIVTLSRASARMNTNSAGVLTAIASGAFGIDYDPATLAVRGMPVEEQRTNSLRNNTMVGAVAGTPGTLPTNWTSQSVGGVSLTEVGSGTEDGIEYVDVRFTGTTGSTASGGILTEGNAQISAVAAQVWTGSAYVRLIAGDLTGINFVYNTIFERSGAGTLLAQTNTTLTPTSAALRTQRVETSRTLTDATTAYVQQRITLAPASGVAIDVTLRIGLPQLEQGAFASSVIRTTTAAATRLADSLTIGTLSPWFNATEGTLYAEFMTGGDLAVTRAVVIDDGTNNQYIAAIVASGGGAGPYLAVVDGGASQANIPSGGVVAVNTIYKLAGAYKANDFAASRDGGAVSTDGGGTIPAVTTVRLGADSGANMLNGHLRKTIFYPIRKPDAELVTMST